MEWLCKYFSFYLFATNLYSLNYIKIMLNNSGLFVSVSEQHVFLLFLHEMYYFVYYIHDLQYIIAGVFTRRVTCFMLLFIYVCADV